MLFCMHSANTESKAELLLNACEGELGPSVQTIATQDTVIREKVPHHQNLDKQTQEQLFPQSC